MAFVRARQRKTGLHYYVIEWENGKKVWRGAGAGKKGKAFAQRWANRINEIKLRRRAGWSDAEAPQRCAWTIADLRERDEEAAEQRGLVMYHRRSCWRSLVGVLGENALLDSLTPDAIRGLAAELKRRGVKDGTVNRYRTVLSGGLKLARHSPESGYSGDPFREVPRLPEKDRRVSVALTDKQSGVLVKILRPLHAGTANSVELLLVTASRWSQRGEVDGGALTYPAQKRGNPRSFKIDAELKSMLARPRSWSRRAWEGAREAFRQKVGVTLQPRDLRTTAATHAFLAGATVEQVQQLLGHRSPAMAQRLYIKLFPRKIRTVRYSWIRTRPVAHAREDSGARQGKKVSRGRAETTPRARGR